MDQGRQERDQVDAAVMLLVRRQRGPASVHALAYNLANFMRTLALPEAVAQWSLTSLREKLDQDRRQGRAPCPLRHLPDGRGRGAEGTVRGNLAADRRTATKTGPSIGLGRSDASSPREECV